MADKINHTTELNLVHVILLFLTPVSTSEIITHINSLKNKCSSGIYTMKTITIKIINKHILKPLKHLINFNNCNPFTKRDK